MFLGLVTFFIMWKETTKIFITKHREKLDLCPVDHCHKIAVEKAMSERK